MVLRGPDKRPGVVPRPPRGTLAVRGSGGLTQGLQVVRTRSDRQAGGLGDLGGGLAVARQRLHLRAAGLTWPERSALAADTPSAARWWRTPAADRPVAPAIWASAGTCSRRLAAGRAGDRCCSATAAR